MSWRTLDRLMRRAAAPQAETCGLCGTPVGAEHPHVLDERDDGLLCACRACVLLFGEGTGHYRPVPERRVRLTGLRAADLGVPVGLAFFTVGHDGAVTARYPSPAGATGWEVDPEAWSAAVAACPPLAGLAPRVEALLVNTLRGADEQWLVPVTDCHRLVAVVRGTWKGLSGGSLVGPEIEAFFTRLGEGGRWCDDSGS
ncbi:DUF5947 family protein [Actinocorallia sp. API 0066]|uniref:DUF5947 family protein n=1 Tax=Actinocorallia sp. API 0066 TaxID=2896846 RepID=UPI001E5C95D3|nr:DUF5947 family protein [Actinocorallia sp. API 0066]MCD0449905.1 DUF5947 family protein [Actinocorallia sp. API 0066]